VILGANPIKLLGPKVFALFASWTISYLMRLKGLAHTKDSIISYIIVSWRRCCKTCFCVAESVSALLGALL